jgi:FAD:protein FMN transferase
MCSRELQDSSTPLERVGAVTNVSQFRRAQMQLGTLVSISLGGMPERDCIHCARSGFAAIASIHKLMSFHEFGSDVDRVNRCALRTFVEIDPLTAHVLQRAMDISAASNGAFDVTIAGELVSRGLLPRPQSSFSADPGSSWRDIEIVRNRVRFHRPLWIDLGGIAKGFAVDYAVETMAVGPDTQLCIDAGGDLRIQGKGPHAVRLRVPSERERIPILVIPHAISVASSSGLSGDGAHLHGALRTVMGEHSFVTVMTEHCMMADAMTKVAMAMKSDSHPVLCKFGATALIHERDVFTTLGVTE